MAVDAATPRPSRVGAGASELIRPRVVVPALAVLAAALGFLRLDARSLYLDEVVSINRAGESWGSLWTTVRFEDPNMSAYYALLKVWTGLFGSNVTAVRSLSVVAAALTVPAVYSVGSRLLGETTGMVAALLVALNAYFLHWAQTARSYTLVALLVTLSWHFFLGALEQPRWPSLTGYVACTVLAFHAHYYAAWVTLVQVGVLLAVKRRRALTRSWIVSYAVVGVLVAPMAYWALTLGHNPIGWLSRPDGRTLWDVSAQISGDSMRILVGILGACLLALPAARRSRRLAFGLAVAAAWVAVPLFGAFAVSQTRPILTAYYLLVSLPGMAILAAAAVTGVRSKAVSVAILVWLLVVSAPPLKTWHRATSQEDWKGAAGYVVAHERPGDAIVFHVSAASRPFDAEARGRDLATHIPVTSQRDVSALSRVRNDRVWLVLAYEQIATERIRAQLARRFERVGSRRYEGQPGNWAVTVELYVRRAA
jgi:mannosyltransferase